MFDAVDRQWAVERIRTSALRGMGNTNSVGRGPRELPSRTQRP